MDPKILQKYAIGDDNEIEKALQNTKVSASGIISVKSNKTEADKKEKRKETSKMKREGSDGGRGVSNKTTSSRYHMRLHPSNRAWFRLGLEISIWHCSIFVCI